MKKTLLATLTVLVMAVVAFAEIPMTPPASFSVTPAFTGQNISTDPTYIGGTLADIGDLVMYMNLSIVTDQASRASQGFVAFRGAEIFVTVSMHDTASATQYFAYLDNETGWNAAGTWPDLGEHDFNLHESVKPYLVINGDMTGTTITHLPIYLLSNALLQVIPNGTYFISVYVDPLDPAHGFPADGVITPGPGIPSLHLGAFCGGQAIGVPSSCHIAPGAIFWLVKHAGTVKAGIPSPGDK